jgi:hypothetical protein
MTSFVSRAAASICAVLIAGSIALGQTSTTGALRGTISDSTGAVIPGAIVTVTDLKTNEKRVLTAASNGTFTASLLTPGNYRVDVTAPGFEAFTISTVTVNVTETAEAPIHLTPGKVTATVTVTGVGELLQTQDAALGAVVDSQQINSLPLAVRNFTQILALSPGVQAPVENAEQLGRGSSSSEGGGVGVGQNTHGQRNYDNNYAINGIQVNDIWGNASTTFATGGGIPVPSPDALQEYKVQTAQYDASFGRNSGAQINIVTAGGGNKFHGSLFEFFRNEDLDANDWFANFNGQPRGVLRQNQYGGTIGGPIVHDKLYFFGNYQGTKQSNGVLSGLCFNSVTTPLLTNDRSAAAIGALFAGQTGVFGGVAVAGDGSNINPVALQILNTTLPNGQYVLPTPQTTRVENGQTVGFSSFTEPCSYTENQFIGDLSYTQTQKSAWFASFFWSNSLPTTTFNGGNIPGGAQSTPQKWRDGTLSNTYSFTSNLVNQVIYGVNSISSAVPLNSPVSWNTLGIPTPIEGSNGLGLSITNSYDFSQTAGQSVYQFNQNVLDLLSWTHRAHTFRFGGNITRSHVDGGEIQVPNSVIFLSFADFLLGLPGAPVADGGNGTPFSNVFGSIAFASQSSREYRAWQGAVFGQDDWQVSPRLTLNLGFRYERIPGYGDELGRNATIYPNLLNPNPATGGSLQGVVVADNFPKSNLPLPPGVIYSGSNLAYKGDDQNTFAPRFGFAAKATDNIVLRGGYGIFYSIPTTQAVFNASNSQPWAASALRFGPVNAAASLQNAFPNVPDPSSLPTFQPYSPTSQITAQIIDPNYQPAIAQVFSLNVQTQISHNFVYELGYVGALTHHASQALDLNEAGFATPSNPIRGVTDTTVANIPQRVRYEGFGSSGLTDYATNGFISYNGLETMIQSRTWHRLNFQASYTFSKTLDSDALGAGTLNTVGDYNDASRRYGPAQYDRRHRFVVNYVYEFPNAHDSMLNHIFVNGWRAAGITVIQSGVPVTPTVSVSTNYAGLSTDFAELAPGCKLVNGGSIQHGIDSGNGYLNNNCIAAYPVVGSDGQATGFGNASPNAWVGPGQDNTDFSLIKNTPVAFLNSNVEFQAQSFNTFNHPQFANPYTTASPGVLGGAGFGQISATSVNPRILQFALKYNF